MNYTRPLPLPLRRLLLAPACALLILPVASFAQSSAAKPDAKTLAKYDKNKNGRLDADELTALQADEAKASATPVEKSAKAADENVIQMSPFTVDANDENGYAASSTMSGTRLNSKLEDLAGSISVITKQQLLDTAALDLNDIFAYEVGTEGTKQFTDPTNDGRGDYDNVSGNPTGANRMRGLSQANVLVDGFTANSTIPVDPNGLDGVEISRGPNSTLAGLSDAGGTVNLVSSRANVSRETTSSTMRVDSYEGFYFSVDLNRPIFKNKFALRFNASYGEVGYARKPSVDRTNRQKMAFTYRPFRTTTLSGSYERFGEWAQRANALTPRDTITNWRNNGKPTYNNNAGTVGGVVAGQYTVNGVPGPLITTMTGNVPNGISLLGSSNARNLQFIDDGTINFIMRGGQPNNTPAAVNQFTQSSTDNSAVLGPLYKLPGTTSRSSYDWTDINLYGPNYQIVGSKVATLSLEQELFQSQRHRADLSLGWRWEDATNYSRQFIAQQDGVGATLEIDTNEKLIDGRPNPFFLHPFIGGLAPQVFRRPQFAENYRAQAAYQIDLRREPNWVKWLGFHRVSGYGEMRKTISAPSGLRYHDSVIDNPDFLGAGVTNPTPTTNLNNSNGALFFPLYYMGNTPGGGVEYANTGPVNPNAKYTASFFNATPAPGSWNTNDPVTIKELYFSQPKQKKIIRTAGVSFQSFFFKDRIVGTYGLRKDRVYSIDNLPTTLSNGFIDETNLDNFGQNKKWKEGTTKQKGIVVRPFRGWSGIDNMVNRSEGIGRTLGELVRGFSFTMSRGDSFLPADTAYNLFLGELPNPTSNSEEYGFRFDVSRKFSFRLTHQETTQFRTRAGTGTIATRVLGMDFHPGGQNLTFNLFDAATGWQLAANPALTQEQAQDAAAKQIGYTLDFINNAGGKTIADASDATSKGWELEVNFNPNSYWTNKLTGNQQTAIDSNISVFIQDYIDLRMPLWTSIKMPDGTLWWETRQGSNGVPRDYFTGNIQTPLNLAILTQGKRKPQTREYSFTYVTSFRLAGLKGLSESHRWMKNVTVGGSYRWSSNGAIGYYAGAPDSDGVVRTLDANKPIWDHSRDSLNLLTTYRTKLFNGRIGTTFQLNVNNVLEGGGRLQPVAANPDGRPWSFRILDPRQYILQVRFDL